MKVVYYVLKQSEKRGTSIMKTKSFKKDLAICAFFLISATLVSYFFFISASNSSNAAICYMLAVFFISRYTDGYLWGFVSSVIGVVAFNYIYAFPYFAIDFFREGYPLTFLGMLTISLITSAVTTQLNNQKQEALDNEQALTMINQFNEQILGCQSRKELLKLTTNYLSKLNKCSILFIPHKIELPYSDCPRCLYDNDTEDVFSYEALVKEASLLTESSSYGSLSVEQKHYYFLPVSSQEQFWGTLFFHTDNIFDFHPDSHFSQLMISQIALSLEHFSLLEQSQKLALDSEKEKMRSNLLRAVSHDLRTPLTGMIGASSTYLDAKEFLDEAYKDQLIQGIYDDANWLLNMVENLLSVTKIDQTQKNATVAKQPEPLEEVISEALMRFKKRYPDSPVNVSIPEEFLMIPMDATLIEQVIINLLENAVVHGKSEQPIDFYVETNRDTAIFHIRDYGKGIPAERIPSIFDGYALSHTEHNDTHKGMGIGLSICKTIILAHQGTIEVIGHDNGAEFLFQLPLV